VVEVLKPQGFKERSDGGMLDYLSGNEMPGIKALEE
jgi:3-phosphoglycerate kinase